MAGTTNQAMGRTSHVQAVRMARGACRNRFCRTGLGADRAAMVACHGRRARAETREDRHRFQQFAEGLQGRSGLQGHLSRGDDRRDRSVPRQAAATHHSGVRGRHRDDDGGQGRGLSGLRADEGRRGAVRSEGLPTGGGRLLHRHPGQHVVLPVQFLDPGTLLQQGPVQEGRARSEFAAENLARGRRGGREAAGGRRALRLHQRMAVLDQHREFVGLAQCADRHPGERVRRIQYRAEDQRAGSPI